MDLLHGFLRDLDSKGESYSIEVVHHQSGTKTHYDVMAHSSDDLMCRAPDGSKDRFVFIALANVSRVIVMPE